MISYQSPNAELGSLDLLLLHDILLEWSGAQVGGMETPESRCLAKELVDIFDRGPRHKLPQTGPSDATSDAGCWTGSPGAAIRSLG